MPKTAAAIFHQLLGQWTFKRHSSEYGDMTGDANFQYGADKNTLLYNEKGVHFAINDKGTKFFQHYTYRLNQNDITVFNARDEEMLNIHFADGHYGCGDYMCGHDRYSAELTMKNPDQFGLIYTVKSTDDAEKSRQKDYTMRTDFIRKSALQVRVYPTPVPLIQR